MHYMNYRYILLVCSSLYFITPLQSNWIAKINNNIGICSYDVTDLFKLVHETAYQRKTLFGKAIDIAEQTIETIGADTAYRIIRPWAIAGTTLYSAHQLYHRLDQNGGNFTQIMTPLRQDLIKSPLFPTVYGAISAITLKTVFNNSDKNLLGIFINDIVDSYTHVSQLGIEMYSLLYSRLAGCKHKITLPAKPIDTSKTMPEHLLEQLEPLFFVANAPQACYQLNIKHSRGIIVTQQSDRNILRNTALAIAGSLQNWTEKIAQNGASWSIIEVSAQELIVNDKKLDQLIKEAKRYQPTVLLVTNIDILYSDTVPQDYEFYSKRARIISSLNKLIKADSSDAIICIATAASEDSLINNEPLFTTTEWIWIPS